MVFSLLCLNSSPFFYGQGMERWWFNRPGGCKAHFQTGSRLSEPPPKEQSSLRDGLRVGLYSPRALALCSFLVASQNLKVRPKTAHTSDIGFRGLKLELTFKSPSWEMTLIILEEHLLMWALKGEEQSVVYLTIEPMNHSHVWSGKISTMVQ